MGRERRVGGSGWAGVHGSFVGLSKGSAPGKGGVQFGKAARKKKAGPIKIDLAKLPDNEEVQKAAKRVLAVQTDIESTKKRLTLLQSQLAKLTDELKVAQNLAKPIKARRPPAKPKSKTSQPNPKPAKNAKPSAAARLAEKKARENFRNAPKAVEVEVRSGDVIVGKRIVKRP